MSEYGYRVGLLMAAHLRAEHGWTWKRLRKMFSGYGSHFWEEVRWTAEDMQRGEWRQEVTDE